jgi:hypothetical protein
MAQFIAIARADQIIGERATEQIQHAGAGAGAAAVHAKH